VRGLPGAVEAEDVLAGVLVGGAGKRMGERAKGLLEAPGGGTIVARWRTVLRDAGVARVVLVGRYSGRYSGRQEAYEAFGLETIEDEPVGVGPIGGLAALLRRAGASHALALACDMPFVSRGLIARLIAAPEAAVVAPRRDGLWEPLCARYDARRVLPLALRRIAAGQRALQPLLTEAGAVELALERGEASELRDWDTPDDVLDSGPLPDRT
jgi:molybdopterin-guanine dinucleotide biosynthesis protein A